MPLFGRLFGARIPLPAPTTVVIDPELAATLTAGGEPLEASVHTALRAHLAALAVPPAPEHEAPERVPFWLQRDDARDLTLEDKLRDRVINRHESESDSRT